MTTAPPGTIIAEDGTEPVDPPTPSPPLTRRERRATPRRRLVRRLRALRSRPATPSHTPPGGEPTRAERRRAARPSRRRQRIQDATVFAVTLALVLVIGHATRHSAKATASSGASTARVRSASIVLAHRTPAGDADLLAVLGANGRRTAVLLVPTSTLVAVPSYDVQPLAATLRLGGPLLLQTSLVNALAIDVGPVVAVDDGQLNAMFGAAGSLSVRSESVQDLAPSDAVHRLVDRGGAAEIDHLVDVQAVMAAWFRALGRAGVLDATIGAVPRVPDNPAVADATTAGIVLRAVAGRGANFDTVGVERIDSGGEAYRITRAALPADVRAAFAGRDLGRHRPRIEILNGTGEVGLAQRVAARIVPAGFEVVLTNNAPHFGYAATLVVVQDRKFERQARALLQVLRAGKLSTAGRAVSVADITIVVGSDFT